MKTFFTFILFVTISLRAYSQLVDIPSERWQKVEQYLSAQQEASAFFLLGNNGKIIYEKALGFANKEQSIPFTKETLYSIGSITKPFTATAILLLMEQGKLNPKYSMSKYLSNVPNDKKGITLHHLLTHSYGFPGAIGDDYEAISTEEFLNRIWEEPLLFAPGSGYEYSK